MKNREFVPENLTSWVIRHSKKFRYDIVLEQLKKEKSRSKGPDQSKIIMNYNFVIFIFENKLQYIKNHVIISPLKPWIETQDFIVLSTSPHQQNNYVQINYNLFKKQIKDDDSVSNILHLGLEKVCALAIRLLDKSRNFRMKLNMTKIITKYDENHKFRNDKYMLSNGLK